MCPICVRPWCPMFEVADQSHMRLTRELFLPITDVAAVTHLIHVPCGYTFDGASIPRLAWSLIGAPFEPDFILAACVHDWYCEHARCYHERLIGDAVFLKLLADSGVAQWRRSLMYLAVRAYAFWLWRVAARYRKLTRRRPNSSASGTTCVEHSRPRVGGESDSRSGFILSENALAILSTLLVSAVCTGMAAVGITSLDGPSRHAPDPSWVTRAVVTRVVDGDTVEVEIRRTLRVRMLQCWAQESRHDPRLPEPDRDAAKARGQAAKAHLQQLAEGQAVTVQVPLDASGDVSKAITIGRVLGHVWLISDPAESLAEKQVKAGHATPERTIP